MRVRLRIEPPGLAPFERDFDSAEIVIGRGQNAGLVVPDNSVSRQHARFVHRDGRWWIEDLGATNRTILNDALLSGPTGVGPGDRVQIGDTRLQFIGESDDPINNEEADDVAEPVFLKTVPTTQVINLPAEPGDRQAERLRLLNDIHRALATPISLSNLLDLILERCFDVIRPEEGVILLKSETGEMRRAASRRQPGAKGDILVSRRLVEVVAGQGQSALVIDAAVDERFATSDSLMTSGFRSVLAAPLIDAEGTIGMIALYSRANVRQFQQQDLDLLVSLASAAALRVRNVALAEEAAARRVLDHELALAHDMQMAMLPRKLPERPEVALAAALKPARSVGGDLYDFVLTGDRLWFIVADVSGKGVAAALYMAVAKTLFRATIETAAEPAHVLARMNAELSRENDQLMFVTALIGHLTLSTGDVMLGDGGHNPSVVIDTDGKLGAPIVPKGMALGVRDTSTYESGRLRLHRGQTLVLYTDGATDARDVRGELFGAERLERALAASAEHLPVDLVASVLHDVDAFAAGAPPEDDLTLLAIRYRGSNA